ncbi:MAG: caspase family protein [Bacteroidia bacterium]|nr:caspase family protein [Bacteroidia bacterium]
MMNRIFHILIVFTIIHSNIICQTAELSQPLRKSALVIGNGNYISSVLSNPENDARAMDAILSGLGFVVFKYENLNQSQMKKAIDDFGLKLKGVDVGLFFYAGHGIQANGYNYLIPVDAQLATERQIEYDCVQADRILALMEGSGTKVNIIILDACRNNPFERSWTRSSTGRGLAFMNAPSGTLIAYSTAPGTTALDGSGNNSPYTSAILESIQIPGISITQMFQNVTRLVSQKTGKQQVPWISSSLTSDFYFATNDTTVSDVQIKNNAITDSEKTLSDYANKGFKNESVNKPNINVLSFGRDHAPYLNGVQIKTKDAYNYLRENDIETYRTFHRQTIIAVTGAYVGTTGLLVACFSLLFTSQDLPGYFTTPIFISSSISALIGLPTFMITLKVQSKWMKNYNSGNYGNVNIGPTENGFGLSYKF